MKDEASDSVAAAIELIVFVVIVFIILPPFDLIVVKFIFFQLVGVAHFFRLLHLTCANVRSPAATAIQRTNLSVPPGVPPVTADSLFDGSKDTKNYNSEKTEIIPHYLTHNFQ
nr:hypothetical protein [Dyadobacter fermentans]